MKPIIIFGIIASLLLISSVGIVLTTSDTWTGEESLSDKIFNFFFGEDIPDKDNAEDVVPSDTIDSTAKDEEVDTAKDTTDNATNATTDTTPDDTTDTTTTDTTDSTDTTTTDDSTPTVPRAPLNEVTTSFRIKSTLPLSNAFWGYDNTKKYVYLANAKIITYQDSFEIGEKDYKTVGTTGSRGYSTQHALEEQSFSEWDGKRGNILVKVQHPDIVSSTGALSFIYKAPTKDNSVVIIGLLPDVYKFSTQLKKVNGLGTLLSWDKSFAEEDDDSGATIKIEEVNACIGTSIDWRQASFHTYSPIINVYLSTDKKTWKKQNTITKDAFDANGLMHVLISPQILTAEQGYAGNIKFDMNTRGSKVFYVKFASTDNNFDVKYKYTFDVSATQITNIKTTRTL